MPKIMIEVEVDEEYCRLEYWGTNDHTCPKALDQLFGECSKHHFLVNDIGAFLRCQACKDAEVKE